MTQPEATAVLHFVVSDQDTAAALGSGDVPVLATPRLLAWLEAATCAAASSAGLVGPDQTSVGIKVTVEHRSASAVGEPVQARAHLVEVDGRTVHFAVEARDGADRLIADGEVSRAVLNRERFLSRLARS